MLFVCVIIISIYAPRVLVQQRKKSRVTKNSHFATLPNHGIECESKIVKTHNIRTNFYGPFGEFIITDQNYHNS